MPKRTKALPAVQPAEQHDVSDDEVDADDLELSSDEEVTDLDGVDEEGAAFSDDDGTSESEEDSEEDADDEDGTDSEASTDEEDNVIKNAMLDYMRAVGTSKDHPSESLDGDGDEGVQGNGDVVDGDAHEEVEEERPVDPGSDSSEDERPSRNTVGDVPLHWYKDEDIIGYNREGQPLLKAPKKDRLDKLLDRNDNKKALRTIYDEYNDEEITLTKEELGMIMRIRKGQFPHAQINPYEPYVDWFTRDVEIHPINSAPEPKRRFIPSKWEEKKVVKLVRAIRKGWLKVGEKEKKKEPEAYLLWADDNLASEKTAAGLSYIPAAKPKLPGHEESYNPPPEYLPSEEEVAGYALMDPEDRPKYIPQAFKSLREVPAYSEFINERFERCLDLYLCPRVRKKRMFIDPDSLLPKLPKPQELQPFPTTLAIKYTGHTGKVRCVSVDPSGQWLASGSDDGTIRLWEVATGRCMRVWEVGAPVRSCSWCPNPQLPMVAATSGKSLLLIPTATGSPEAQEASTSALTIDGEHQAGLVTWRQWDKGGDSGSGIQIDHPHLLTHASWHSRGDYLSTVAPSGNTQSVLIHQLSKRSSQNPFKKNRGRVVTAQFHPSKPFFLVATQNHVRIYNLAKQELSKKLIGGSGAINCMAIHPSGDHVLTGCDDTRVAWFDLDLSTKPYKALRYHKSPVRGVAYHRTYPLFASASDDGSVHVFHGMVYADLLTNALIVPVKILRGHTVTDYSGVMGVVFHPTQPWVFTAGADSNIHLYCN